MLWGFRVRFLGFGVSGLGSRVGLWGLGFRESLASGKNSDCADVIVSQNRGTRIYRHQNIIARFMRTFKCTP